MSADADTVTIRMVGDALAEAGFDVILHATNHALDRGGLGLSNALSFWKTQHPEMTICGINESQEEQDTLRIVERKGIRVVVSHVRSGHANVVVYPLADYPEELAAESEIIYQDANYSRDYLTDLCSRVWEGMELL